MDTVFFLLASPHQKKTKYILMRILAFVNPCSDHWQDLSLCRHMPPLPKYSFCAYTQSLYFYSENKHQMAWPCIGMDIWFQKHPWTSTTQNLTLYYEALIQSFLKDYSSIFSPYSFITTKLNTLQKEQNTEDLIHNGMLLQISDEPMLRW